MIPTESPYDRIPLLGVLTMAHMSPISRLGIATPNKASPATTAFSAGTPHCPKLFKPVAREVRLPTVSWNCIPEPPKKTKKNNNNNINPKAQTAKKPYEIWSLGPKTLKHESLEP